MLTLDDTDFDDIVGGEDTPVLVDFTATWCGRCRLLAPAIERIAAEYAGRLRVVKVDVEASPGLAGRFAVAGLPTLVLLRAGEEVRRAGGTIKPADVRRDLQDLLA